MPALGLGLGLGLLKAGGAGTASGLNIIFNAPLTHTLVPIGGELDSFARTSAATVSDFEGLTNYCLPEEIRLSGARREYNLIDGQGGAVSSEDMSTAAIDFSSAGVENLTFVATGSRTLFNGLSLIENDVVAIRAEVKVISGDGLFKFRISGAAAVFSADLTATSDWQIWTATLTAGSGATAEVGVQNANGNTKTIAFRKFQATKVSGKSITVAPEYVSVGVLASAPYHGANVDGVKYFITENGNTASSNILTEIIGATIANSILKGCLPERAATNIAEYAHDFSAARDAEWVPVNITKGSTSIVCPDGESRTTNELTASSANGTLLQQVTASSSNRNFSCQLQRKTGVGDIDITVDGGSTWTTKTLTGAGTWDKVNFGKLSITNPEFGIRIVTSGDAVYIDEGQCEATLIATSFIENLAAGSTSRTADSLFYDEPSYLTGANVNNFVVVCRVTRPDILSLGSGIVWELAASSNTRKIILFFDFAIDKFTLLKRTSAGDFTVVMDIAAVSNTEYLIACKSSNTTGISIFIDGVKQASTNSNTSNINRTTTPEKFAVGCRYDSINQFDGYIKNINIYGKDLTDAQVSAL